MSVQTSVVSPLARAGRIAYRGVVEGDGVLIDRWGRKMGLESQSINRKKAVEEHDVVVYNEKPDVYNGTNLRLCYLSMPIGYRLRDLITKVVVCRLTSSLKW